MRETRSIRSGSPRRRRLPARHRCRRGNPAAGALPLLYGMAEGIVTGATYVAVEPVDSVNKPAMGVRRSRQMHGVGVEI